MRQELKIFAGLMEQTLVKHDDQKGEKGWLGHDCSVEFLVECLDEEVKEMRRAYSECDPYNMSEECIDIANFAMMIHGRISKNLS